MKNKSTKERKTMTKLSKAAQVSKLLKAKAKSLGLEVRASSKNFSGGNSVDIKVLKGSDKSFNELKEYSSQFKEGHDLYCLQEVGTQQGKVSSAVWRTEEESESRCSL